MIPNINHTFVNSLKDARKENTPLETMGPFIKIPTDIINYIFYFSSVKDLLKMQELNRGWKQIGRESLKTNEFLKLSLFTKNLKTNIDSKKYPLITQQIDQLSTGFSNVPSPVELKQLLLTKQQDLIAILAQLEPQDLSKIDAYFPMGVPLTWKWESIKNIAHLTAIVNHRINEGQTNSTSASKNIARALSNLGEALNDPEQVSLQIDVLKYVNLINFNKITSLTHSDEEECLRSNFIMSYFLRPKIVTYSVPVKEIFSLIKESDITLNVQFSFLQELYFFLFHSEHKPTFNAEEEKQIKETFSNFLSPIPDTVAVDAINSPYSLIHQEYTYCLSLVELLHLKEGWKNEALPLGNKLTYLQNKRSKLSKIAASINF